MSDIPPPAPTEGAGVDDAARQEAEFFSAKPEVPELAAARREYALAVIAIKRTFLRGVRGVCYLLPWLGFAMLVVWLIHIIGPEWMRWLKPDEVAHLQALLFSGAISALATAIATKQV